MIEVVLAIPGSINKDIFFGQIAEWLYDGDAFSSKKVFLTDNNIFYLFFCRNGDSLSLMQVTALSHSVQRIPYPIPPAGADPATYRSEEDPPPFGFTYPFMPNVVLLDEPIQVRPPIIFLHHGLAMSFRDPLLFHSPAMSYFFVNITQGRLVGPQCQCLEY